MWWAAVDEVGGREQRITAGMTTLRARYCMSVPRPRVEGKLVQAMRDVGARSIRCCGEDFQFGGRRRGDLHEVSAPQGAPQRRSGLPSPNRASRPGRRRIRDSSGPVPQLCLRCQTHAGQAAQRQLGMPVRAQDGLCRAGHGGPLPCRSPGQLAIRSPRHPSAPRYRVHCKRRCLRQRLGQPPDCRPPSLPGRRSRPVSRWDQSGARGTRVRACIRRWPATLVSVAKGLAPNGIRWVGSRGCSLGGAGNLSWYGMSSAVRRRTLRSVGSEVRTRR